MKVSQYLYSMDIHTLYKTFDEKKVEQNFKRYLFTLTSTLMYYNNVESI